MLKVALNILVSLVFLISSNSALANPQIYVSDQTTAEVSRYQNDGSERERLLTSYESPSYLEIDTTNDFLYWPASAKILRCAFDGTGFEVLYNFTDGLRQVTDIAVDPANGFIYWADYAAREIVRGSSSGTTDPVTLFNSSSGVGFPIGVAIDVSGGKIYWTQDNRQIYRANLDGTGAIELIINTASVPIDLLIDVAGGKIYWTSNGGNLVERGNLNGVGGFETLYNAGDGVSGPSGLALDSTTDILYIAEANGPVKRGGKDGVGALTQIFDASSPSDNGSIQGIAVDPSSDTVFFTGDVDVYKGNRDGTASITKKTSLRNSIFTPSQFALDLSNNKLYSIDNSFTADVPSIKSVDLDFDAFVTRGSLTGTVTTLFDANSDGLGNPHGIAVDPDGGKVYWGDTSTNKIQRGNIDGSGSVEDLFDNASNGIDTPLNVRLDATNGFLYWINQNAQKIQRGSTSGVGAVTDLFDNATDGIDTPTGLAIDVANGFIYWGDSADDKIYRGNIDGTGSKVEIFNSVDNVANPQAIYIDAANSKLLWIEAGKIYRGNLDGSGNVEEVIIGHLSLVDLVLTPDADGDEVPDEIDGCANDANKTSAGDCGCGAADTDSNSNNVSDCLLNQDVKQSITDLIALIKSLKPRKKKKQKARLAEVRTIANNIRTLINTNLNSYNLAKGTTKKLKKQAKKGRKQALKARKTTAANFKTNKRRAIKTLRKLNKFLA